MQGSAPAIQLALSIVPALERMVIADSDGAG
jgi:hypothetical protein